jgi:hypothetical protein
MDCSNGMVYCICIINAKNQKEKNEFRSDLYRIIESDDISPCSYNKLIPVLFVHSFIHSKSIPLQQQQVARITDVFIYTYYISVRITICICICICVVEMYINKKKKYYHD